MAGHVNAVRLTDSVHWVGYIDWSIRDFHGYSADRGTTYNAYLVQDEKTALVDTVKDPHADELLRNISALTDPAKVDYVVCNHAEPDHAGALPAVMKAMPNATLVCNKKCVSALSEHFDISGWDIKVVATDDTISLGNRTLKFIDTPMVHWPESMFTFLVEEGILMSMDAFGQHNATSKRFDDEVLLCTAMQEAKAYYANIIMPYGKQAAGALKKTDMLGIKMIAPSHGIIWRSNVETILKAYRNWSASKPKPKVMVVYDSMWGSTGRMAQAIHDGVATEGVESTQIHIRRSTLTHIATEMLDSAAVAFGSSTLNRNMMPMAGAVLTYLKGLRPLDKAAFAFGSYGWGPGGPEAVNEYLEALQWDIVREPLKSKYVPSPEILDECRDAGKMLAVKAKQLAGGRSACGNLCENP